MPKVLIAGENAFAIHSFTQDELDTIEITETRNDSVAKIGHAFDQSKVSEQSINSVKASVMMFLKQSDTYKIDIEDAKTYQGYILCVFKGKSINGRKNYMANWLGKMPEDAINNNPQELIPKLLKAFKAHFKLADYNKKSIIHKLIQ